VDNQKWDKMWTSIVVIVIFVGILSFVLIKTRQNYGIAQKYIEHGYYLNSGDGNAGWRTWVKESK